jgi:hypothetical protein
MLETGSWRSNRARIAMKMAGLEMKMAAGK